MSFAPPVIGVAATAAQGKPATWTTGIIKPTPPRLIINGVEGIGKSTIGAFAPGAAIIQAREETGYETLLSYGRVPSIPRVTVNNWIETLATIRAIAKAPGDIKTLVLDAMGGLERLCHEYVCETEFGGDWGEKGFGSYQRGYDISIKPWLHLIAALDACKNAGIAVIMISHVAVKTFDNPEGKSFSRYETACHKKTWDVTHKWADAVLFFNYRQALITEKDKKTHGSIAGGRTRVMYTKRSDAYDAKNRLGLPDTIEIPEDHTKAWETLASKILFYNPPTPAPATPPPTMPTKPPTAPQMPAAQKG